MDVKGGEDTKLEGPVGLHVNTIPIIVSLIRKYKHFRCVREWCSPGEQPTEFRTHQSLWQRSTKILVSICWNGPHPSGHLTTVHKTANATPCCWPCGSVRSPVKPNILWRPWIPRTPWKVSQRVLWTNITSHCRYQESQFNHGCANLLFISNKIRQTILCEFTLFFSRSNPNL